MIGKVITIWFFGSIAAGAGWYLLHDLRAHLDERKCARDEQRLMTLIDLEESYALVAYTPLHERGGSA